MGELVHPRTHKTVTKKKKEKKEGDFEENKTKRNLLDQSSHA